MKVIKGKQILEEGDTVTLKYNITNKPAVMMVKRIDRLLLRDDTGNILGSTLMGIRCLWFDVDSRIQEAIFNSKDLIYVND